MPWDKPDRPVLPDRIARGRKLTRGDLQEIQDASSIHAEAVGDAVLEQAETAAAAAVDSTVGAAIDAAELAAAVDASNKANAAKAEAIAAAAAADATKAPLASPALTGSPTAPTPAVGDDSTKLSTTAFVQRAVGDLSDSVVNKADLAAGALTATAGRTSTNAAPVLRDFVSVKDFGAKGDCRTIFNAAMTSGSATMAASGAGFTSGDVGKSIYVMGAATAGGLLITTITTVQNSTTITLAASAGTTVSGATSTFGTNDTAAINAAVAALTTATTSADSNSTSTGGEVRYPPGMYWITEIAQRSNIAHRGGGMRNTVLIPMGTNYAFATNGLTASARMANVGIEDMTIAPISNNPGLMASRPATGGIDWRFSDRCWMKNVTIHNVAGIAHNFFDAQDFVATSWNVLRSGVDANSPALWISDTANALHFFGGRVENCAVMLRSTVTGAFFTPFDIQFVGTKFEWNTGGAWVGGGDAGMIFESATGFVFSACSFASQTYTSGGTTYPLISVGNLAANQCTVEGLTFDEACTFKTPGGGGAGGTFYGRLLDAGVNALDITLHGHAQGWGYVNGSGVSQPIITTAGGPLNMDGFRFYDCQAPLINAAGLVASSLRALRISAPGPAASTALIVNSNSRLINPEVAGVGSYTSGISLGNNTVISGAVKLSGLVSGYFLSGSGAITPPTLFTSVSVQYGGAAGYRRNNWIGGYSGQPGTFHPAAVGQWYTNPLIKNETTGVATLNSAYLHLFYSGPDGVAIDQYEVVPTVAGTASQCRVAVYIANNQDNPFQWSNGTVWGTLLTGSEATIATTSTGSQIATLGTPVVVPPNTWFGIAGVEQGTAACTKYWGQAATAGAGSPLGGSTSSAPFAYGAQSAVALLMGSVSGAFGSSFTPSSAAGASHDAGVGFRRSA